MSSLLFCHERLKLYANISRMARSYCLPHSRLSTAMPQIARMILTRLLVISEVSRFTKKSHRQRRYEAAPDSSTTTAHKFSGVWVPGEWLKDARLADLRGFLAERVSLGASSQRRRQAGEGRKRNNARRFGVGAKSTRSHQYCGQRLTWLLASFTTGKCSWQIVRLVLKA